MSFVNHRCLIIVFPGNAVKRIVITSSIRSIHQKSNPEDTFYDDHSWSDEVVCAVEVKGDKVALDKVYYASKPLAERGGLTSR
jgi:hypothetical protein